jgi:hypothetical protein
MEMIDPQAVYESWVRQAQERRLSHHYVSRFYLRGFADQNRRVAVLDRRSGRIKITSVKRAAAKEHFYTVETETGEQEFTVEAMLGWLENQIAPVLRNLLNGEALEAGEREVLLVFMTFQIMRGPDHRAVHSQLTDWWAKFQAASWPKDPEGMREVLREASGTEPTDDQVQDALDWAAHPDKWEVEPHQNESIKIMLDTAQELYPALASRHWNIVEVDDPLLVTSDRPVFHWSKPSPSDEFYGTGFANADEVRFPLDARRMLILTLQGPAIAARLGPEWAWELNKTTASRCHDSVYARPGNPQLPELAKLLRGRRRPGIEIVDGGRRILPA